jgi:hypothetical protein
MNESINQIRRWGWGWGVGGARDGEQYIDTMPRNNMKVGLIIFYEFVRCEFWQKETIYSAERVPRLNETSNNKKSEAQMN